MQKKGDSLKQKNSSSARPHGGGFICQNSVVTGAGRFGTSRLELNVESNFRCDQVGRSLKSRSSDQLCAPSVKLYVGLSSLSEIFLASWGMKLIISSVPPDMRFSRRRFLRFAGQPAFPACPYHLGHMVIGVALADSISAFEVIALIVHWSFLPCEIALKLHPLVVICEKVTCFVCFFLFLGYIITHIPILSSVWGNFFLRFCRLFLRDVSGPFQGRSRRSRRRSSCLPSGEAPHSAPRTVTEMSAPIPEGKRSFSASYRPGSRR